MSFSSLQTFVINLDRSPDRLAAMQQRLKKTGLPWQRVSAVEGRKLELEKCQDLDIRGYQLRHGKTINPSEVGCYLSHIRAMQQFLATDAEYALILEDDADFPEDFTTLLNDLLQNASLWDVVKLSSFHSGTPFSIQNLSGPYRLAIPFSRHCNSNSLLINRHTAQVLTEKLTPMQLPYDHALERSWLYGLKLRIVSPSPCRADTGFTSTINPTQPIRYKFPFYRRFPTFGFRIITEISRLFFALFHVVMNFSTQKKKQPKS